MAKAAPSNGEIGTARNHTGVYKRADKSISLTAAGSPHFPPWTQARSSTTNPGSGRSWSRRATLIFAGLYQLTHELIKTNVLGQVREFYLVGFDESG